MKNNNQPFRVDSYAIIQHTVTKEKNNEPLTAHWQ
jgi:hypothetical protein